MDTKRVHHFHAESTALHAQLQHPLTQEIEPQSAVKLARDGGYLSERVRDYHVEGVVSYKSAYTHVAGHQSPKPNHGWITLTTSSIEHLNVLDIVTADRVVAQTATEHPLKGYVPSVTFLGTRFENLRIAGELVEAKLDVQICEPKPKGDGLYLADGAFLKRIGSTAKFPKISGEWKKHIKDKGPKPTAMAEGSLARTVKAGRWKTTRNVIEVPDFGKIILAELKVDCDTFHLTMIRLEMGCIAGGKMSFSTNIANGTTEP